MTILDAVLLGVVQGVTEFLPISSSGHLIIARAIFGFSGEGGLAFDAVLQLATALAILVYYAKDLWGLCTGFIRKEESALKEVFFLGIATIPAVLLGLFLESYMESAFRSTALVAGTLLMGAGVMAFGEWWMKRQAHAELSARGAIGIGLFQSLALIPGMSRSGMTIAGGLIMGLTREAATRFAFLLGIPILVGSGGKKLIDILDGVEGSVALAPLFWGSITAFVVGLVVIHYLLKYLRTNTLMVFVWYRVILALIVFASTFLA